MRSTITGLPEVTKPVAYMDPKEWGSFYAPANHMIHISKLGNAGQYEIFGPFPYGTIVNFHGPEDKPRPHIRVKAWKKPNELWRFG